MVTIKYLSATRSILPVIVLTTLLQFLPSSVNSQKVNRETPPLRERIFFGGDFGLQFGTYTDIEIAPVIGLWVLPRVAVAAGPEYTYYAIKNYGSTSIFGARVYTQLVLIQDINNIIPAGIHLGLFVHAEDEIQSFESDFWDNTQSGSERFNVNALLFGGGISQPMGRRGALNIIALWALDDPYKIYSSPEIRISFTF
jgi:hypothetical protein